MLKHYMKDVSSRSVLSSESSLIWNTKRTVLTQEALMVMLNCSRDLPWDVTSGHLSYFSARMQFSGYDHEFRYEVIRSAMSAYDKLRRAETKGERPLYRPRNRIRAEREKKKMEKKTNWYQRGWYESVIFVPATPGSALQKRYQEEIRKRGFRIRVVEKASVSQTSVSS